MNDEIKEILERIKTYPEKLYCLSEKEKRILLDYITNLQQENEELKKKLDRRYYKNEYERIKKENERLKENNSNMQEEMARVWEENERLKEQLESVINENQRLLKQWFENNDKVVELISEKEYYNQNFKDYKTRCEKASEYIEK